jgi:hypothetical protein
MKLRWLLPLVMLPFLAASKKAPDVTVRFHSEANPRDTDTFAVQVMLSNPPRQAFISKIPDISEKDIQAIYPFPAPDGSMGCAFKLDEHGRIALDSLSIEKRGQSVVATMNGRQVVDMQIDRRVSDGVITIQRGLTQEDIAALQKKFRIVGEAKKRRR